MRRVFMNAGQVAVKTPLAVKRRNVVRCQQSTTFAVRPCSPGNAETQTASGQGPRNRRRPAAVAFWRNGDRDLGPN